MSLVSQFAGLDMEKLVGGPLKAVSNSAISSAAATADFINRVGFDKNGKARMADFTYYRKVMNPDGTSSLDEMKTSMPLIAIVPVPNLQIDEVNILFDMEVKQCEASEETTDINAAVSAGLDLGLFSVNITGNVATHSSNTRSSDYSAKYHVDVRASNHGMPEGLARVMDIMAQSIVPEVVSSEIRNADGGKLSEAEKEKAENLRRIRSEISSVEKSLSASEDILEGHLQKMDRFASMQLNVYQSRLNSLIAALDPSLPESEIKKEEYSTAMTEVSSSWASFRTHSKEYIEVIADSTTEPMSEVSGIFSLKELDENGQAVAYAQGEAQYAAILSEQNSAAESMRKCNELNLELLDKKKEYNSYMIDGSGAESAEVTAENQKKKIPAPQTAQAETSPRQGKAKNSEDR